MSAAGEHWFDRLAAPRTRRQTFKAALAGAGAALTIPLVRTESARAQNPNACRRGCFWTSHHRQARRENVCQQLLPAGPLPMILISGDTYLGRRSKLADFVSCQDGGLMLLKAMQYDCMQPGCPGFDPHGPDGPCPPCDAVQGGLCCADEGSFTGYSCCTHPPYCCDGNGLGCVSCGG